MNEPIDVQTQLLEWLKNAVDQGVVFIQGEAPQLVSEVIAWHFWSNTLYAAIFAVLLMAIAAVACRYRKALTTVTDDVDGFMISAIVGIVACVLAGCFVASALQAIKSVVAPRIVIIEEVKGLVK